MQRTSTAPRRRSAWLGWSLGLCLPLALGAGCAASPPSGDRPNKAPSVLTRRGVSLAGADFAPGAIPGTFGVDYTYPTHAEVDYYTGKGMTELRIPFLWERLQPTLNAPLDPTELARLDDIVGYTLSVGGGVLLDPHNYARYAGGIIGSDVPDSAFADFWSRLADHYKSEPRVDFGLMNEPHDMTTEAWLGGANAAIATIRAAGANNLITVPGNAWTSALSWNETWYGTANGIAMQAVVDPANNFIFEVHQYLDTNSSGTDPTCDSETIGSTRLASFTAWLRQKHMRGFLGEFGTGGSDTCLAAVDDMLSYIDAASDVYVGWTWWAAGPWWNNYPFSVEPTANGDAPQMGVLAQHLTTGAPPP